MPDVIGLPSLFTNRREIASSRSVNQSGHEFDVINSNKPTAIFRSSICSFLLPASISQYIYWVRKSFWLVRLYASSKPQRSGRYFTPQIGRIRDMRSSKSTEGVN